MGLRQYWETEKPHNQSVWAYRHKSAVLNPAKNTPEYGIVLALRAWIDYAAHHQSAHGAPIGEDYVLGPAWARWGEALHDLLDGGLGDRLDAGTLSWLIITNIELAGFDWESRDWVEE